MKCETARQAISALLDDEDPALEVRELDAHLAGCPACRYWKEAAHRITRLYRLQPADVVPTPRVDLAEKLAAMSPRRSRPALGSAAVLRVGLVLVAAVQLAIFVPMLIFGHDHDAPIHVAHEMGSFDVALAVGFIVCACRPSRALGMLAVVAAAALLLMVTTGVDLAEGRTDLADEVPHLLVFAGWLLLRRLAAITPPGEEGPISALVVVRSIRQLAAKRPTVLHAGPGALGDGPGPAWSPANQTCDPYAVPAVGAASGGPAEASRRTAS